MALKEKIEAALASAFSPTHMEIEDEDGITGFVVSARFTAVAAVNRQRMIEQVLQAESSLLEPRELRRVHMIAALTPDEARSFDIEALAPSDEIENLKTVVVESK